MFAKKSDVKIANAKITVKNIQNQKLRFCQLRRLLLKRRNQKNISPATPKQIIYSNKANQESVQPLFGHHCQGLYLGQQVLKLSNQKAMCLLVMMWQRRVHHIAIENIKIIGTVDFTGADVKDLNKQW